MKLSEELSWRGFVHQTTFKQISDIDSQSYIFYLGIDPSADSMTIGQLSMAMMIKLFIQYGHKPVLLVGGATGLIGDPDGKAQERNLKSYEEIQKNKDALVKQYRQLFASDTFEIVDNYEWFKDMGYLRFLRDIGKHVPLRQMLAREFVQSRVSASGDGLSYAEFSYSLIQGYDFVHLYEEHGVTLQLCGSDQWGNSIAGVDLIRRLHGIEANVWSAPLVINKQTGVKFGKSESGAVWLDADKTSPTEFYQFWINCDDDSVQDYLKIYTQLSEIEIRALLVEHKKHPQNRLAQIKLAEEVTKLVHGFDASELAHVVTSYITGQKDIGSADDNALHEIRNNIQHATVSIDAMITDVLVSTHLATSKTDARRLLAGAAISINNVKIDREQFKNEDFHSGKLLIRRGRAYKDSALVELE